LGSVTGTSNVGGFVGSTMTSEYDNCYAAGTVTGSSISGGFAGFQTSSNAENSYWDAEASGQTTSALALSRNTAQMVYPFDAETYLDWDFFVIWSFDPDCNMNAGYPFLNNLQIVGSSDPVLPVPDFNLTVSPNPFTTQASVSFALDKASQVILEVYNLKGQKVRSLSNAVLDKGNHAFIWDGKTDSGISVGTGIYLCRLSCTGFQTVRRLTFLK
jgi:hypothetical protein